jgi:predicted acylesterase/phospholipase RssA
MQNLKKIFDKKVIEDMVQKTKDRLNKKNNKVRRTKNKKNSFLYKKDKDVLIVSSGGLYIASAFSVASELYKYYNFKKLVGISGGASLIFASLPCLKKREFDIIPETALNYDASEIVIRSGYSKNVYNVKNIYVLIKNLLKHNAIFTKESFIDYMGDLFEKYGADRNVTFGECKKVFGVEVEFYALDIMTGTLICLGADTTPDMKLTEGVYATSCIPLMFPPLKYRNYVLFDGAIHEYFPYQYYKDKDFIGIMLEFTKKNNIKEKILKSFDRNLWTYILFLIERFYTNFINTLTVVDENHEDRCIRVKLPYNLVDSINFWTFTPEKRKELIDIGYKTINEFISTNKLDKIKKVVKDG